MAIINFTNILKRGEMTFLPLPFLRLSSFFGGLEDPAKAVAMRG